MPGSVDLMTVLKELYHISGFRISVYDTERNELAAYPAESGPFCRLVKENEKTAHFCKLNDARAFDKVKETNQVYLYKCSFGLYDAVAPLYSFGKLVGYLMMGQTLDSLNSSRSYAFQKAAPYFTDRKQLTEAVEQTPMREKEMILSCLSIMTICAEYITLTNRLESGGSELSEAVRQYIDRHFAEPLTVSQLCARFFCSRSTLLARFSKNQHTTINAYLTEVRLSHAREMLLHTARPVREIAEACGFSNQNYFTKVFTRANGCTPTQFRKKTALS